MDQWTLKRCRYQDFEWSSLVGTQSCPHPPCFRLLDCAVTWSEPQVVSINELQPACGTVAQISRELSAVAELCPRFSSAEYAHNKASPIRLAPGCAPATPTTRRAPPSPPQTATDTRTEAGRAAAPPAAARSPVGQQDVVKRPYQSSRPGHGRVEWCGDGAVWAGDGVGVLCREVQAHRQ